MRRRTKKAIYVIGAFVILAPILPFYFLHELFEKAANGIDWLMQDRAMVKFLMRRVERLELWSIQ